MLVSVYRGEIRGAKIRDRLSRFRNSTTVQRDGMQETKTLAITDKKATEIVLEKVT